MRTETNTLGSNARLKVVRASLVRRARYRAFGLEPGMHLNDVSEFQGNVNWGAYNRGAVVARADSGFSPDLRWSRNQAGARASCRVRGFYQYIAPGRDVTVQANRFCDLVGTLLPGEFVVADWEDPGLGGDLRGGALQWFNVVRGRLHTLPSQEFFYSYWPYVGEHFGGGLGWLQGRPAWIAGYSGGAPFWRLQAFFWQHTDGQFGDTQCEPGPGIGNCDCSVFGGTLDQLAAAIGGAPVQEDSSIILLG